VEEAEKKTNKLGNVCIINNSGAFARILPLTFANGTSEVKSCLESMTFVWTLSGWVMKSFPGDSPQLHSWLGFPMWGFFQVTKVA
jgi:hypothetical protein